MTDEEDKSVDKTVENQNESKKEEIIVPDEAEENKATDTEPESIDNNLTPKDSKSPGKIKRAWASYLAHKKRNIPLTILAIAVLIMLIPNTRYMVLGLFIKNQYAVTVYDSTTNLPVATADVSLDSQTVQTDQSGNAILTVPVGNHHLKITKKYYQDFNQDVLVSTDKNKNNLQTKIVATGRQVTVTVTNKITGKGIDKATVKAADTEAQTDSNGEATIVLPVDKPTLPATLSATGYNDSSVSIQITDQKTSKNSFAITPTGKVYFLSKASGKIDVVKTNLDGTERKTVLAGTGNEDNTGTVLLASRDWKYLVLLSKRTSSAAKLYLIDTSDDKLTTVDEGKASFTLIGWLDHNFAYQVNRDGKQVWDTKAKAIKTYNADSKTLSTVDETQATGAAGNYAGENISWVNIMGTNKLSYYKYWEACDDNYPASFTKLSGKKAQLINVTVDKSITKKVIKSYDLPTANTNYENCSSPYSSYESIVYEPQELFFSVTKPNGNPIYFKLDDDQLSENNQDAKSYFDHPKAYPTYLISPSGTETFWSESRDGKNTLFVGDKNGDKGRQIVSLSPNKVYGWFTNDYLLVSKDGSELYIMSRDGSKTLKISDYHKPDLAYYGYGGGYGGI